ncbi:MAG: TolC family protein [Planctomycetota bacterium]
MSKVRSSKFEVRNGTPTVVRTVSRGGAFSNFELRSWNFKFPPSLALCALMLVVASGCAAPLDNIQVILDRHARAVAKLPEEQQSRMMPYGEAVVGTKAEALLPDGVLTVEAARSTAVRANPDVHAAQARLETAAARIAEAEARYYPTVVFVHDSSRTFHTPASRNRLAASLQPSPVLPTGVEGNSLALTTLLNALRRPFGGLGGGIGGNTNPFSEHTTALTMTWTIYDGYVREAQLLSAKYLRQASMESLMDVQRLIVRAVDTAYYQVQLAQEQSRIARADETFSEEQHRETKKLQAAGRATSADVDNFRVRVLAAQAKVSAAEGLRETGRVVLAELMGLPDVTLPKDLSLSPLGEETAEELAAIDQGPWLGEALANRPDILQLEEIVKSEEENVRATKGLYRPSVLASGSWGFDRGSNVHYEDDDQSSAAAVEFRWELFTGGARGARVRGAESHRAEAAATLNRLRLSVQAEVRKAIIDLTNAQTQIRLHRETVATALENRRVVQAGYLAGKENLNRLNEAQRDLITADADLALARIRLRQAWSDLHAAAAYNGEGA